MLIPEDALPDLPIRAVLDDVVRALAGAGAAVLVAPPGTGKTTVVPLALVDPVAAPGSGGGHASGVVGGASPSAGGGSGSDGGPAWPAGRVVVAEPRRVAARAAARRMAELIGEPVGRRVGYTVRGDRKVSRETVIEVVTTGVLVRRLQRDPELPGTAVVILDECHERHLDSDLALAFLVEVRSALRPDLRLLATSATAESHRLAEVLGGDVVNGPPGSRTPGDQGPGSPPSDDPTSDHWTADAGPADARPARGRTPDHWTADAGPADAQSRGGRTPDHRTADAGRSGGQTLGDRVVGGGHGGPGAGDPGDGQDRGRWGGGRSGGVPVIEAQSRLHPVEIRWSPPPGPIAPPLGLRVDPKLLDHVAATIRRALGDGEGDVLAFLPGAREIDTVAGRLRGIDADVVTLHGRQSGSTQDAALRPAAHRRVVLATAIAESSLTVPGVRAVVDAGLSRVPRMDHSRGLGALVTVPVSRAAALQRAGRAGREGPGQVYRCWSEAQHDRLSAQPEAEIAAADLTGFALDLAEWGHPDGTGLALPDAPPAGALQTAIGTLHDLGATDSTGRITARGRTLAEAGLHPRLARALLDGAPLVGAGRAAEIVALLAEDRSTTDDLVAALRRARADRDPAWRTEVRRLTAAIPPDPSAGAASGGGVPAARPGDARLPDDLAAGLIVGLAYPERVARVRETGGRAYLMAGGTAAELSPGSGLAGTAWLAVAVADRAPGARTARIRAAAPLDEATAREAAAPLLTSATEIGWADGDVVARAIERLGAITLLERRLDRPDPARLRAALLDGLRREGLGLLTWTRTATELRERLAFAHSALGDPWPAMDDAALLATAADWLDLGQARRRSDLARIDVASALRKLLPWSVAGRLDDVAPERLPVPSGSRVRLDYSDPAAPVLAVKVQEAFGWRDAPRLADGRIPVLLHLLSPAGRPVAVTRDLASFWATGYPQVRAELRGRYPRHPWPEDPTTATPTNRTTHRR